MPSIRWDSGILRNFARDWQTQTGCFGAQRKSCPVPNSRGSKTCKPPMRRLACSKVTVRFTRRAQRSLPTPSIAKTTRSHAWQVRLRSSKLSWRTKKETICNWESKTKSSKGLGRDSGTPSCPRGPGGTFGPCGEKEEKDVGHVVFCMFVVLF